MRFSLKWILAATAYTALAAAALSVPSLGFLLALWAISLLGASYALLLAIAASGRPRLVAAGYALLSAVAIIFLAILLLGRIPTPWYSLSVSNAKVGGSLQSLDSYRRMIYTVRQQPGDPTYAAHMERLNADYKLALRIQSLHAISVLAAGCVGALLGLCAFWRVNRSPDDLAA